MQLTLDLLRNQVVRSRPVGGQTVSGLGSPRFDLLGRKTPIGGQPYGGPPDGVDPATRELFQEEYYGEEPWQYPPLELPVLPLDGDGFLPVFQAFPVILNPANPVQQAGRQMQPGFVRPQPGNQPPGQGPFIPINLHDLDTHVDFLGPSAYGERAVVAVRRGQNAYDEVNIETLLGRFFTGQGDTMLPQGPDGGGDPQDVQRLAKGNAHDIMSMDAAGTTKAWRTLAALLDTLAGAADGKFLSRAGGVPQWVANPDTDTQHDTYCHNWHAYVDPAVSGTWYDCDLTFPFTAATEGLGLMAYQEGTGVNLSIVFRVTSGHTASNLSFRFKSGSTTSGAPTVSDIADLTPARNASPGTLVVAQGDELRLQVMQDDGTDKVIAMEAAATFGVEV